MRMEPALNIVGMMVAGRNVRASSGDELLPEDPRRSSLFGGLGLGARLGSALRWGSSHNSGATSATVSRAGSYKSGALLRGQGTGPGLSSPPLASSASSESGSMSSSTRQPGPGSGSASVPIGRRENSRDRDRDRDNSSGSRLGMSLAGGTRQSVSAPSGAAAAAATGLAAWQARGYAYVGIPSAVYERVVLRNFCVSAAGRVTWS
jgi:hypothetical protein